ncbi:kinase-like domain, phloem protein 2-like protein, partial [Tanacetum coccineum]
MDSIMKEFEHLVVKLEEFKAATDNFNDTKIIGKGGFGNVYEGELSLPRGKTKAAFKHLDRKHGQVLSRGLNALGYAMMLQRDYDTFMRIKYYVEDCFDYSNAYTGNIVHIWKQRYEENKLDEIMFKDDRL